MVDYDNLLRDAASAEELVRDLDDLLARIVEGAVVLGAQTVGRFDVERGVELVERLQVFGLKARLARVEVGVGLD